MEPMGIWQGILLGVIAILVILWFRPGIRASLERSRTAKKDWPAVMLPLAIVVLFVVFLISMVR